jgi:hypothetical protein
VVAVSGCVLVAPGCKRREPVHLQETDESPIVLSSIVHMADPNTAVQLLKGFHAVEQNSWRWTMGRFAVTFKAPAGAGQKGATLVGKFTVPEAVIKHVKSTALTASVAGKEIGSQTYNSPGDYTFTAEVPAALFTSDAMTVDFSLSNFLPAGTGDGRELGIVVTTIALEPK